MAKFNLSESFNRVGNSPSETKDLVRVQHKDNIEDVVKKVKKDYIQANAEETAKELDDRIGKQAELSAKIFASIPEVNLGDTDVRPAILANPKILEQLAPENLQIRKRLADFVNNEKETITGNELLAKIVLEELIIQSRVGVRNRADIVFNRVNSVNSQTITSPTFKTLKPPQQAEVRERVRQRKELIKYFERKGLLPKGFDKDGEIPIEEVLDRLQSKLKANDIQIEEVLKATGTIYGDTRGGMRGGLRLLLAEHELLSSLKHLAEKGDLERIGKAMIEGNLPEVLKEELKDFKYAFAELQDALVDDEIKEESEKQKPKEEPKEEIQKEVPVDKPKTEFTSYEGDREKLIESTPLLATAPPYFTELMMSRDSAEIQEGSDMVVVEFGKYKDIQFYIPKGENEEPRVVMNGGTGKPRSESIKSWKDLEKVVDKELTYRFVTDFMGISPSKLPDGDAGRELANELAHFGVMRLDESVSPEDAYKNEGFFDAEQSGKQWIGLVKHGLGTEAHFPLTDDQLKELEMLDGSGKIKTVEELRREDQKLGQLKREYDNVDSKD